MIKKVIFCFLITAAAASVSDPNDGSTFHDTHSLAGADKSAKEREDLLRQLINTEGAALSQEERARLSILQDVINETLYQEHGMISKMYKTRIQQQESSSVSAASANKRGSAFAHEQAKQRLRIENIVNSFLGRLLDIDEINLDFVVLNIGDILSSIEFRLINQVVRCPRRQFAPCDRNPRFRTIDGTCNNFENPLWGSADVALRRLLPPYYEDGATIPRGRLQAQGKLDEFCIGPFDPPVPSARLVSKNIVLDDPTDKEATLTHIVMQWGQFLDHDFGLSPESHEDESEPLTCQTCEITDECEPIRIPPDDPVFGGGRGTTADGKCLQFRRSEPVCTNDEELQPREQINDLTSFIDGSQIYGSNDELARRLRTLRNGLMKTSAGNNLPRSNSEEDCGPGEPPCFLAGDVRTNEQVGLTAMHTLFVREHNRIANALRRLRRSLSDELLYQSARKIVGAILQKITYDDYLPIVLGSQVFRQVIQETEYDPTVNPTLPNVFATSAYRYGHSLVRPVFNRFLSDAYENGANRPLDLVDSFFNQASFLQTDLGAILRGLISDMPLRTDEFMNSVMTTQLFADENGQGGMDLAALNIQRGRGHGLPLYEAWTSFCQNQFPELETPEFSREETIINFLKVYGSTQTSDLFVAGLSERKLEGSLLGPTNACLFGITFSDVRNGDQFFYEHEGVFTPEQLREIKKYTLSKVICENTDINMIQRNAFLGSNGIRVPCDSIEDIDFSVFTNLAQVQEDVDEY